LTKKCKRSLKVEIRPSTIVDASFEFSLAVNVPRDKMTAHSIPNTEGTFDVDEASCLEFSKSRFRQRFFTRFEAGNSPVDCDYGETAPAYGNTIAKLNTLGKFTQVKTELDPGTLGCGPNERCGAFN
jgi:hypothetical protein